jgi:DNA-binding NarL/FixJ family response regulator
MRLLIVDDEAPARARLRRLLGQWQDCSVVAEAASAGQALQMVAQHQPDALLLDISMPGLDGIDATTLIRQRHPDARIVLVTVHAEPVLMDQGLAAGALGYVLKDSAGDELVTAVYAALDGQQFVSHALRWKS